MACESIVPTLLQRQQMLNSTRVYECATPSRLPQLVNYSLGYFSTLVTYLLYDIDLALILPEVLVCGEYGLFELLVLAEFGVCMVSGLWYEYYYTSFSWRIR